MANNQNLVPATSETAAARGRLGGLAKKGSRHISTWIDELLNDETFTTTVREGLEIKQFKGAPAKAIVKAQIHLAVNGDTKAADMLFKHGYGTKTTLSNDPDSPITTPVDANLLTQFLMSAQDNTKR